MKTQKHFPTYAPVAVFLATAVIYVVLIFLSKSMVDAFTQSMLIGLGSALFGSGLTFFLVRFTQPAN